MMLMSYGVQQTGQTGVHHIVYACLCVYHETHTRRTGRSRQLEPVRITLLRITQLLSTVCTYTYAHEHMNTQEHVQRALSHRRNTCIHTYEPTYIHEYIHTQGRDQRSLFHYLIDDNIHT
jgi:hypothetical protein